MARKSGIILAGWWMLTIIAFAICVGVLLTYTPREQTMGDIQKIFYLHLPVAINTFVACLVCFVASVGYLLQRKMAWDDLASSSAKVAVLLCTIVLLTGMIWGRGAWGLWWTWSPRLTFSLMLWLLYVVYVIVRNSLDSPQRRAVVGAVYSIIAFLDVPLVYLSARLMPDIHPASIGLDGPMKVTLMAWFVPVTMATAGLIVSRYLLARTQDKLEEAEEPSAISASAPAAPMAAWEALLKTPAAKVEATRE